MLNTRHRMVTYIIIRISGDSTERFLNLCRHRKINIWDIRSVENGITGNITIDDFYRLKEIRLKTGMKVEIIKKKGLRFLLFKYRKHYAFVIGMALSTVILKLCSLYIWDIAFTGNREYTDSMLLKELATDSVTPGIMISAVNCDSIEKKLRSSYDNITWVSAEIRGTRLIVHIKENDGTRAVDNENAMERDIVATHNGTVKAIITRNGTPVVKPGDAVEKGQILVSGVIAVHNDSGDCVGKYYTAADADISINTDLEYCDILNSEYEYKNYTEKSTEYFILGFINKNIEIGLLPQRYEESDTVTDINIWKLTNSFYLPICTGTKKIREYNTQLNTYTDEEAEDILNERLNRFICDLSENKVQIIRNSVTMEKESACYSMKGSINVDMPAYEYAQITDTLQLSGMTEDIKDEVDNERN